MYLLLNTCNYNEIHVVMPHGVQHVDSSLVHGGHLLRAAAIQVLTLLWLMWPKIQVSIQ